MCYHHVCSDGLVFAAQTDVGYLSNVYCQFPACHAGNSNILNCLHASHEGSGVFYFVETTHHLHSPTDFAGSN